MELARDGAWKFAESLTHLSDKELDSLIMARDQKVAEKMSVITNPGLIARIILSIIRQGERGSVSKKKLGVKKMET